MNSEFFSVLNDHERNFTPLRDLIFSVNNQITSSQIIDMLIGEIAKFLPELIIEYPGRGEFLADGMCDAIDAYFIALGLVGNREDALELSQEAFLRAYLNIRRFNPSWGFFPWFYQILKNLCFNHLRKTRNDRAASSEVSSVGQFPAC